MLRLLTRTIDARPLALGRIVVGIASLPIALEWGPPLAKVASGDFLGMPVFDGWPPLPTNAVLILVLMSFVASLAMIVGIAGHLPALLVAACAATALLSDQQAYSNHLLLLVLLSTFLGLSGASKALSVGAFRKTEEVPYWPAFMIKIQITTLYAWAAASKVNPQYLAGDVLGPNFRPWVPLPDNLLPLVAIASIAAEAFLAVALWLPKLRLLAFLTGGGLHVGILALLIYPEPLIPFAMLMVSGYALFAHDSLRSGQWRLPVRANATKPQTALPPG